MRITRKKRRRMRKSRRKHRTRKAGMYNTAERERIRKLKESIPLSETVKMRNMTPKEKMKAFKKMGIKKKDVIAIKKLMADEKTEKRALAAHIEMMRKANKYDKSKAVVKAIPIVDGIVKEPSVPPLPKGGRRRWRRRSRSACRFQKAQMQPNYLGTRFRPRGGGAS